MSFYVWSEDLNESRVDSGIMRSFATAYAKQNKACDLYICDSEGIIEQVIWQTDCTIESSSVLAGACMEPSHSLPVALFPKRTLLSSMYHDSEAMALDVKTVTNSQQVANAIKAIQSTTEHMPPKKTIAKKHK